MSKTEVEQCDRSRLSHHEQMLDAQAQCVPCKLCGGKAVISDAGPGAGYYIECSNSLFFRQVDGCLIDSRRISGWAYNVMDWWNRLHAHPEPRRLGGERREPMRLEIALDFADHPRRYDTLQAPADSKEELWEALRVIAEAYRATLPTAEAVRAEVTREIVEWLRRLLNDRVEVGVIAGAIERGDYRKAGEER